MIFPETEKGRAETGENQPDYREYVTAALILMSVLLAAYARELWNHVNLYLVHTYDPTPYFLFYPAEVFASRLIEQGLMPLWNHMSGLGDSVVLPYGIGAQYPLKLIFYLMPNDTGLILLVLARQWAAGMAMYVAARWFRLGRAGAYCAALSYMLCGYFMEFFPMQDMNVYLFYPLAFGLFQRFIRTKSMVELLMAAAVLLLIGSIGHPEAVFFALGISFLLGVLLVLSTGHSWRTKVKWILVILLLEIWAQPARAAEFISFTELWFNAWQYHLPGFGRMHYDVRTLPALIHPFFNSSLSAIAETTFSPIKVSGAPNYMGLLTFVFMITALARIRHIPREAAMALMVMIVLLGIMAGLPLFTELTMFPIIYDSHNHRYLQPIVAFTAAILAGAGLKQVLLYGGRAALIAMAATGAATALVIVVGLAGYPLVCFKQYEKLFPYLVLYTVLFAAATLAVLAALRAGKLSPRRVALILVAMLVLNLLASKPFAGPRDISRKEPPVNKFAEETIDWVGEGRVYGNDRNILHPNIGVIYNINDLREHNPILPKRYAELMMELIGLETKKEVLDHFISNGFFFKLDLVELDPAWLDLLAVDRILSHTEPGSIDLLQSFYKDASQYLTPTAMSGLQAVPIDGISRKSIIFASPGKIEGEIEIPAGAKEMTLSPAMSKISAPLCHVMTINDGSGEKVVYSMCLDGKKTGWRETKFDISMYAGKRVTLSLVGTPTGNVSRPTVAVWGDGFVSTGKIYKDWELIEHAQYRVYANKKALPVAFVTGEKPPDGLPENASVFRATIKEDASRVIENNASTVAVAVNPEEGDWLVLSRVYFPGWRAHAIDSDGKKTERKLYPCIVGFSTVPLRDGDRKIEISYHPVSIKIGWWTTLVFSSLIMVSVCVTALLRISSQRKSFV